MKLTIFQTVRYEPSDDKVIAVAPIYCTNNDGYDWLGEGYYFWEEAIELARWWGDCHYKKREQGYIILESEFTCPDENFLDLLNPIQLSNIRGVVKLLRETKEFESERFSGQFIIQFLRKEIGLDIKAIRIHGIDSCSSSDEVMAYRCNFYKKDGTLSRAYLSLCPEIQICLYTPRNDRTELSKYIKLPMKIVEHYIYTN